MATKVLILGVNGFIGHHLSARILKDTDWSVFGMDMGSERVEPLLSNPRMKFFEGDITINKEWIEYHIRKCDVMLAAGGDRHPGHLRARTAAGVRTGFRGQPADRSPVRAPRQARAVSLDLGSLRHVP